MNRRTFLGVTGATVLGAITMTAEGAWAQSAPGALSPMNFAGSDLTGWETVVGDGIYAPVGVAPVALSDIATINAGIQSSLLTNVKERPIMAHNIAFKRIIDDTLFDFKHRAAYEFRMPNLDTPTNPGIKAQTVEGGFFVWDGGNTRRDHGLGFQWVLNPWDPDYGAIQTWSMNSVGWKVNGYLEPDTEWHLFECNIDHQQNRAYILIDGEEFATAYTQRRKPSHWGTETAARLQVEAISLDPGTQTSAPTHTVDVRNWTWDCTPA